MHYINNTTLEILTALVIKKEPVEINSDWLKLIQVGKNNFSKFESYIKKIKMEKYIICEDKGKTTVISCNKPKELEKSLKEYLNLYKQGELEPDLEINYLSYIENLSRMRNILFDSSSNFQNKKIVLNSKALISSGGDNSSESERLRFLEFVLDVYFQDLKKHIIVTECEIKNFGLLDMVKTLRTVINLYESPDKIYNKMFQNYSSQNFVESSTENIKLTAKQKEVLLLLKEGFSQTSIADKIGVKINTIGQRLDGIYNKLGTNNPTSSVGKAVELKLI